MDVVWHDVECGGYAEDLPHWRELAAGSGGPVLELGCGTGRVALELARNGHEVLGVERDGALAEALEGRAADAGLTVEVLVAEIASLDLGREFALIAAPMQLFQMLGQDERLAALEAIGRHLAPGGVAALAIVESGALGKPGDPEVLPDIRELDGEVFSSRPLWVESGEYGRELIVKRLRERVTADGEVERGVHTERLALLDAPALEDEARAAGLEPRERRPIDNGPHEADSTLVILGPA